MLVAAVDRFVNLIQHFCQENEEVTLLLSEGSFYLNQEKVVFDRLAASFATLILNFFEERHIEGLRFYESVRQASFNGSSIFSEMLDDAVRQETCSWLEEKIGASNLSWVEHVRVSLINLSGNRAAGTRTATGSSARSSQTAEGQVSGGEGGSGGTGGDGGHDGGAGEKKKKQHAIQTYGYAVHSLRENAEDIRRQKGEYQEDRAPGAEHG